MSAPPLSSSFASLDSFIHPHHQTISSNKHIPRFLSTRLNWQEYSRLFEEVKTHGLYTMCTPFDEFSANRIADMRIY